MLSRSITADTKVEYLNLNIGSFHLIAPISPHFLLSRGPSLCQGTKLRAHSAGDDRDHLFLTEKLLVQLGKSRIYPEIKKSAPFREVGMEGLSSCQEDPARLYRENGTSVQSRRMSKIRRKWGTFWGIMGKSVGDGQR